MEISLFLPLFSSPLSVFVLFKFLRKIPRSVFHWHEHTHTCSMNTYQLTDQVSNVGQSEIMFRQAEVEIVG